MQGIEIGSGFSGSRMLGSEHNDEFYMEDGHVRTRTNRCDSLLEHSRLPFERDEVQAPYLCRSDVLHLIAVQAPLMSLSDNGRYLLT